MFTIAISNLRGGTGKTALAVNLAAGFAVQGKRTLLIDADPTAGATVHLGIDRNNVQATAADLFKGRNVFDKAISFNDAPNLFFLPGTTDLVEIETGTKAVELSISPQVNKSIYDIVVIDTPPNFGKLNVAILAVSDGVVIPVRPDPLSYDSINHLTDLLKAIRNQENISDFIIALVPVLVNSRRLLTTAVIDQIKKDFPGKITKAFCRNLVAIPMSSNAGQDVFRYAAKSEAAKDYESVTAEILSRVKRRL